MWGCESSNLQEKSDIAVKCPNLSDNDLADLNSANRERMDTVNKYEKIDNMLDFITDDWVDYNIWEWQWEHVRGKDNVGVYDANWNHLFNIVSSKEIFQWGEITFEDVENALNNYNQTNWEVQVLTSLNSMQENESNDEHTRRMVSTSILNKIANGIRNSLGQELFIWEPVIEWKYAKTWEIIWVYDSNWEHLFNIQSSDEKFWWRITQDDMRDAVGNYKNSIESLNNDPQSILESGNYTAEDIFENNSELFEYIHNYLINGNIDISIGENLFKVFNKYASDNHIILTNDAVIDPKFNDWNKVFSIESKYISNIDEVYWGSDRSEPIDFTFWTE